MKNKFKVLGVMSGSSLDGLDLAFCEFTHAEGIWKYKIIRSQMLPYSSKMRHQLLGAMTLSGEDYLAFDVAFGRYIGQQCVDFLKTNRLKPDFISSHGHTVFHQPHKHFTAQIGNGNALHAVTGLPVVFDFRSLDVQLGGQGAPLVPIGDRLLFQDFDICLNLGGIANLSADLRKKRVAFDVCYCNTPLNYLMSALGKTMDKGGEKASNGNVDKDLLKKIQRLHERWRNTRPSLGRERFEKDVRPLLDTDRLSIEDKLATSVEATAAEIAYASKKLQGKSMLCTGGGAMNAFLMSRILDHCADDVSIVIPDDEIVKFKEALIFAFLGVLKLSGNVNVLSSVTGAQRDSSSGVLVGSNFLV